MFQIEFLVHKSIDGEVWAKLKTINPVSWCSRDDSPKLYQINELFRDFSRLVSAGYDSQRLRVTEHKKKRGRPKKEVVGKTIYIPGKLVETVEKLVSEYYRN
jgi:hypothetical protein